MQPNLRAWLAPYRAHRRGAAMTALELGHINAAVTFAHYRELVRPKRTARYWQIKPARGAWRGSSLSGSQWRFPSGTVSSDRPILSGAFRRSHRLAAARLKSVRQRIERRHNLAHELPHSFSLEPATAASNISIWDATALAASFGLPGVIFFPIPHTSMYCCLDCAELPLEGSDLLLPRFQFCELRSWLIARSRFFDSFQGVWTDSDERATRVAVCR